MYAICNNFREIIIKKEVEIVGKFVCASLEMCNFTVVQFYSCAIYGYIIKFSIFFSSKFGVVNRDTKRKIFRTKNLPILVIYFNRIKLKMINLRKSTNHQNCFYY